MASFIKSANSQSDWIFDNVKEICFVGRSNVGKSSLINVLSNKKIAKTSNTPGRTQLANFFDFQSFRIVDLPGYGYSSVSKSKKLILLNIIDEYLNNRQNLVGVIQICDINVITQQDIEMANFLQKKFQNHYIFLNKADKYSKSHFDNNKYKIANYLGVDVNVLLSISTKNKLNIDKALEIIKSFLK